MDDNYKNSKRFLEGNTLQYNVLLISLVDLLFSSKFFILLKTLF